MADYSEDAIPAGTLTSVARIKRTCGFCGLAAKRQGRSYCSQCAEEYADFMEAAGIEESPHSADIYRLYRFMSMKDEVERIKEKYKPL